MSSLIPLVTDMKSLGRTEEKPPLSYAGKEPLIEFVGYQFYDMEKRLSRVYAAQYIDRSELFCVTWFTKDWSSLDPEKWGKDHWVFAGGMTPVEYHQARKIARETYLSNLSNYQPLAENS